MEIKIEILERKLATLLTVYNDHGYGVEIWEISPSQNEELKMVAKLQISHMSALESFCTVNEVAGWLLRNFGSSTWRAEDGCKVTADEGTTRIIYIYT